MATERLEGDDRRDMSNFLGWFAARYMRVGLRGQCTWPGLHAAAATYYLLRKTNRLTPWVKEILLFLLNCVMDHHSSFKGCLLRPACCISLAHADPRRSGDEYCIVYQSLNAFNMNIFHWLRSWSSILAGSEFFWPSCCVCCCVEIARTWKPLRIRLLHIMPASRCCQRQVQAGLALAWFELPQVSSRYLRHARIIVYPSVRTSIRQLLRGFLFLRLVVHKSGVILRFFFKYTYRPCSISLGSWLLKWERLHIPCFHASVSNSRATVLFLSLLWSWSTNIFSIFSIRK